MTRLEGTGPALSVLQDTPEVTAIYDSFNLELLRPKVFPYSDEIKALQAADRIPNPAETSPTLPDVLGFMTEMPRVDEAFAFDAYIRGVACAALAVDPSHYAGVAAALLQVATRLADGAALPALPLEFQDEIRASELAVFRNGEPVSFMNLLAFMDGAYWLLGFVQQPRRRRKGGRSVLKYVSDLVEHWAALGYVPG